MLKVYSIQYNKPEYIKIQFESAVRHINTQFEFIIIDNSIDDSTKNHIRLECSNLQIKYIDCFNKVKTKDSKSHQNGLCKVIEISDIGDSFMVLDHDVFFMGNLNIDYYDGSDIVSVNQTRGHIDYPWPGIIIFSKLKTKNLFSFTSGMIDGVPCDTGGSLYYYIKYNNLRYKHIGTSYLGEGSAMMATHDGIFLHLISGSDWNSQYDLSSKINMMEKIMNLND